MATLASDGRAQAGFADRLRAAGVVPEAEAEDSAEPPSLEASPAL